MILLEATKQLGWPQCFVLCVFIISSFWCLSLVATMPISGISSSAAEFLKENRKPMWQVKYEPTQENNNLFMDFIFIYLDDLLTSENYSAVDRLIHCIDIENTPLDCLVGTLRMTKPVDIHLPLRDLFYKEVKNYLEFIGETDPTLLIGLE